MMQPEDFKPVTLIKPLNAAAETLYFALRNLERKQVSYNETVEWATFVLSTPEGHTMTVVLLRALQQHNDDMLAAQLDAEKAHREYLAASAAFVAKGD